MRRSIPAVPGVVSAGAWMPLLRRLPEPAQGEVGLSFDDGPTPATTPALIDLLDRHRATATFFLTGERAVQAPNLVEDLVRAGHDVFAHGWRHIAYADEPIPVLHEEMRRAEAVLARWRPTPDPYLVRLPYISGRRSTRMHAALRAWRPGVQMAFWQFGFEDHRLAQGCASLSDLRARCATAATAVTAHRRLPGAVLMLHEQPYGDDAPLSAAVAPILTDLVLQGLASRGLRGVKLRAMARQPWMSRWVQL
jgi:peptidoglycan-N-acetylglucosamine deacetylase